MAIDFTTTKSTEKQVYVPEVVMASNYKCLLNILNLATQKAFGDNNDYLSFDRWLTNKKHVTGAATATGLGFLQEAYNNSTIYGTAPSGGAMTSSGVKVVKVGGTSYSFQSRHRSTVHTYSDKTAGSTSSNDSTGTLYEKNIALPQRQLKVEIWTEVLQGYVGNEQEIINFYENDASVQKQGLIDDLGYRALFDITSITVNTVGAAPAALVPEAATGGFSFTRGIIKAVNQIRKVGSGRVIVQVSSAGLTKLMTEQDNTGSFSGKESSLPKDFSKMIIMNQNGAMPLVGPVASLAGALIVVNNAISDVIQSTANNTQVVATSLTGGLLTAALVFDPYYLGIAEGKAGLSGTKVFDSDFTRWTNGVVSVITNDWVGATMINVNAFTYVLTAS